MLIVGQNVELFFHGLFKDTIAAKFVSRCKLFLHFFNTADSMKFKFHF